MGPQYRSIIFYHSAEQKSFVEKFIRGLEEKKMFDRPIVTTIEPFKNFYEAEYYHKNYFDRNKNAYCDFIIAPKIRKLLEQFGKEVQEEYK